jgi:predicted transcriptional regulator
LAECARECRTGPEPPITRLAICLDPKLDRALGRIASIPGRTKSGIAREALQRQVAIVRLRELRKTALPFGQAQGLLTDQDVFVAPARGS